MYVVLVGEKRLEGPKSREKKVVYLWKTFLIKLLLLLLFKSKRVPVGRKYSL